MAEGSSRHIATENDQWIAVCTSPDFCRVGDKVIPFDSYAPIGCHKSASYNVKAQNSLVYRVLDMHKGICADAGSNILSGTSLGRGYVKILEGQCNVFVNGLPVARHDSLCLINCNKDGIGGAPGKLVTNEKVIAVQEEVSETPPGSRSSPKLKELMAKKEELSERLINVNNLDEIVDFEQTHQILDESISKIQGTQDTWTDYAAQATRGTLGFVKDIFLGIGELSYEVAKTVPKVLQRNYTTAGLQLSWIDAQILAEHIRLGNITPGSVAGGAWDIGGTIVNAIIEPVTEPWGKGDYVEAIVRGAAEIGTAFVGVFKGRLLGKGKALDEVPNRVPDKIPDKMPESNGGVHVEPKPYSNPKQRPKYAPKQVEEVWENAKRPDGKVLDPNTKEELFWDKSKSRAGQWDMGHLPEHEYRRLHQRYMDGIISKEEFLREYRNPANYRPEAVSANRSHRYEAPD